jgi:hypothetical protein
MESSNLHNFPLRPNFLLDLHGTALPEEVMEFLSKKYTVDVLIPRDKNFMEDFQI